MTTPSFHTAPSPKRPEYIEGVGWRYPVEHRMTRWPHWKDSRKSGTYMITLTVNGNQKVLGALAGTASAVYQWMKTHHEVVQAASSDALYYRHALLGRRAMPFVLQEEGGSNQQCTSAVETLTHKECPNNNGLPLANNAGAHVSQTSSCDGVSTPSSAPSCSKPCTHFPLEALLQSDAPHIVLSPLGEKVKECLERMPQVEPRVELICYSIMPNHLHIILAVKDKLKRPIGSVIRSFMGTTTHAMHKITVAPQSEAAPCRSVPQQSGAAPSCVGVSTPSPTPKPSLWQPGYCIGICHTERKLHTRIGYVLENPFFGILESECHNFMERTMCLTIAGREYCAYGNILLLKEPDRLQVFCHRKHPITQEPYIMTHDYKEEKQNIIDASADGVVIVTPGISPGEADIMWTVLHNGGNVINIQKEEIQLSDKWHPEKERRIYCSQGKLLVLSVKDLPHQTFHDKWGYEIPMDTKYAKFHSLNFVAEEICREGIEHECVFRTAI